MIKILIVEDDDSIAGLMRMTLCKNGYHVETAPDGLAAALSRMSGMMASLGDRERHRVSPELREMNRMVWGTQADVNSLYQVLPNMKEFDVHVGRGYTPVESYGRLLSRFLEVEPEHVARYATVLDAPRLHAGPERAVPRVYPGTQKAVENLSRLTPRLFQSSRGSGGGERLWRGRAHGPARRKKRLPAKPH